VGIIGLGSCVPDKVLTNADFERMVETSDEWITSRTGIKERRQLPAGEMPSSLVEGAARDAIENAGLTPSDIDGVIVCTFTPDYPIPSTSCIVQGRMGIPPCIAFDLNGACSGFVYGLQVAEGLVRSGVCKHPLVVGMDCVTRYINYQDRETCVLFGDGAGAVVLGVVPEGRGFLGHHSGADGTGYDLIIAREGGAGSPLTPETAASTDRYVKMNGREVYKFATRVMGDAVEKALQKAGLTTADLDFLVPHQANIRIIQGASDRFKIPMDRIVVNVDRFGNTSAASVALALVTAREEGRIVDGALCALVAFGAGLTFGATVIRW
jgi:3-oxoacyl-[acyl-carrier-protein] synthase-3